MSRAKKTKRAKKYSADNLYRQITEVLNRGSKEKRQSNCQHIPSENGVYCIKCKKRLTEGKDA